LFPFESSGIAVGEAYERSREFVHAEISDFRLEGDLLPKRYLQELISRWFQARR
jgi:hypothetical protein